MNKKKSFSLLAAIIIFFSFCFSNAVWSASEMVVRKYSGVPRYLSEETKPFDLTVEVLDPSHKSYESIEPGSASASFESNEFALEDPSVVPEIKQLSTKDMQGSLRFKIVFKNVVYIGKAKGQKAGTDAADTTNDSTHGSISLGIVYRVESEVVSGKVSISIKNLDAAGKIESGSKLPKPRVKLQGYSYGSEAVSADTKFELGFSLVNTSWYYKLENVRVTVSAGEGISPTDGASNTFFEDNLGPQGELKEAVSLYVNPNIATSVQAIKIATEGEYIEEGERKELKEEVVISVPVKAREPGLNATLKVVVGVKEITEGEDVSLKIIAKNATITKQGDMVPVAYNPSIEIRGIDGFEFDSDYTMFDLKNLIQGDPVEKTISITPKCKTMAPGDVGGASGGSPETPSQPVSDEPQVFKGIVVLTYSDQDHKDYSVNREFSFKIKPAPKFDEMPATMPEDMPVDEAGPAKEDSKKWSHLKKLGIIGGSVVVVLLGGVIAVKKIKAKRSFDDDEDI